MTQPLVLYAVLFGSGLAGLGYELLWTRQLAASLGHEIPATLAVVSAFFAGLALGAWLLEAPIRRSPAPGACYAALETAVGLWSLALLPLLPAAGEWVASLVGVAPHPLWQWVVSFGLPLLLLLPGTVAMGATLPAAERLMLAVAGDRPAVGGLYAANTLGAVAGVMATTLVLVPAWGHGRTAGLLAACNLACAVVAWRVGRLARRPAADTPSRIGVPNRRLGVTLFASGLLGVGYEVLVVRVASQVLENTVYSLAAILTVYLLGTASGAALYQARPPQDPGSVLSRLLMLTAVLVLLGTVALWAAEPLYHAVWEAGGGAFAAGLLAELVVATAVVLLPSASMGATFSHLAQTASVSGFGLGRALSLNTAGAALAPGLVGVLLLPAIGSLYALVACGLGYALLCPSSERRAYLRLAVPAALAAGLVATLSPEALVPLAAGERLVRHAEGVMAAVSVVQDGRGDLHLRINGRFQVGGTSSAHSDRREAHIPLLLHPDPQRALFLGLGAGITFEAAARHPRLVADGVELVPEIVPLMRHFAPELGAPERQANLRVHVADARRYVRATRETYDVVVADLFHPARDGAGSLYTAEHFRAIRERLAPAGLFVQWLPLYQMDLETLRTVVRTFLQVYPEAGLLLAHYSLVAPIVGLAGGPAMDLPSVDPTRLQAAGLAPELRALRLDNVYEVVGTWLADARALAAFAGTGPVNTDDLPVVTYGAPRFAYARQRPPAERLLALIDTFPPDLATALGPERAASLDETTRRRLHDYLLARNAFVHAGVGVSDDMDVKGLLGAVRGPLLEVVRTSRDFGAAYGPLLAMARRLAATDTPSALRLLREVELANPWRLEAAALRRRLLASP